jgi:hypothetical protein
VPRKTIEQMTFASRRMPLPGTENSKRKKVTMPKFQPGNTIGKLGGRPRGSKNRLQSDFLYVLAEDFAQHGADVIKIARIEEPVQYLKIVAGLMPKTLLMGTAVTDLADDELDSLIEALRERVLAARQDEALELKPLKLEQPKALLNGH